MLVVHTLAASHLALTFLQMGHAAENAIEKDAKCNDLAKTYTFIPIACQTLEPINTKALSFLAGRRSTFATGVGAARVGAFFFKCLPITVWHFHSCFKGFYHFIVYSRLYTVILV